MPTDQRSAIAPIKPLDWARKAVCIIANDPDSQSSTRAVALVLMIKAPGKCRPIPVRGGTSGWDFYVSDAEIERLAGVSRSSVLRAKRQLVKLELLVLVARGGHTWSGSTTSSVYRLALPPTQDPLPLNASS